MSRSFVPRNERPTHRRRNGGDLVAVEIAFELAVDRDGHREYPVDMGIISWGGLAKLKVYDENGDLYGESSAGPFMERECGLEPNLVNLAVNVKAPCIAIEGQWREVIPHWSQSDTVLRGAMRLRNP